jgi:hypothetical protein
VSAFFIASSHPTPSCAKTPPESDSRYFADRHQFARGCASGNSAATNDAAWPSKGKVVGRRSLATITGIVTPETILRWYRLLVANNYDGSRARRPGRPSTKPDIAALFVRIATKNPTWGYTPIRCGLKGVGHDVARNTIKAILKDGPGRDILAGSSR